MLGRRLPFLKLQIWENRVSVFFFPCPYLSSITKQQPGNATEGHQLTIHAQGLALLHVGHEELLLLVGADGEALFEGEGDGAVDVLALLLRLLHGHLLLHARAPPLLPSEVSSEVGVGAPLVVEVDYVC